MDFRPTTWLPTSPNKRRRATKRGRPGANQNRSISGIWAKVLVNATWNSPGLLTAPPWLRAHADHPRNASTPGAIPVRAFFQLRVFTRAQAPTATTAAKPR